MHEGVGCVADGKALAVEHEAFALVGVVRGLREGEEVRGGEEGGGW